MRVKKAPKPEAEPKPKKVAPKTEAPGPIEKEIPAMPVAESRPVEPVEVSCVFSIYIFYILHILPNC